MEIEKMKKEQIEMFDKVVAPIVSLLNSILTPMLLIVGVLYAAGELFWFGVEDGSAITMSPAFMA